jgi:hypothetical protein
METKVVALSASSILVTASLAVVGTLLTTAFGWLLSLVGQKRQHKLALEQSRIDRESERLRDLHRRGREVAEHAVDALVILRAELPKTVGGRWDDGAYERCERELNNLEQLSLRLPDPHLRSTVDTASRVLAYVDQIGQWSGIRFGPYKIVRQTCNEAIGSLGMYLREEPLPSDLSAEMKALEEAYGETIAELDWQHQQQQDYERQERERVREQQLSATEDDAGGEI